MKNIFVNITLSLFVFFSFSCEEENTNRSADVAIYFGNGVWDESQTAAENMFRWMNLSVALIDAKYINENSLDGFKIICVPGGDMYQYSLDISATGKEKIRSFVINGGGYIGLCGGAYFASKNIRWQGSLLPMQPLALFDGTAEGTIDAIVPYPQRNMCQINLTNVSHPIIDSISSPVWILYYWGAVFTPNSSDVTILGKYAAVDKAAMLSFNYGNGKVFLIGTHPEIEEDSERDGVVLEDTTIAGVRYLGDEQLDDKGSDWDLMKNVVDWILKK